MIKGLRILAVIPARGGSKGLPGKNIINLAGKPLIAYTIEAAKKSRYIDRIIVSTDYQDIARVSEKYRAEVPFLRPKYLASDTAHTPPVIRHAVRFLERQGDTFDIIVTLQPTSPLRTPQQIDQAIEVLIKSKCDSVVSVKPTAYPPYWLVTIHRNGAVPFVNDGTDYFKKERQQLPRTYQINGAVYVTRKKALFKENAIITKHFNMIVMDDTTSLDIDTQEDLKRIRELMKSRHI